MLVLFARVAIGGVFAISTLLKLASLNDFADGLTIYRVPRAISRVAAWSVVAAEAAITGAMLAGPPFLFAGLCGAAALIAVFSAVLIRSVAQGNSSPCYCFGASKRPASWPELVRNAGLVLLAAVAAVLLGAHGAWTSPWSPDGAESVSAARWLVIGVGGLFALAWSQLPQVTALLRSGSNYGDKLQESGGRTT
jgi:Methylamine utilisation protein MauE